MAYRWRRSRPCSRAMFISCAIRPFPASGEFWVSATARAAVFFASSPGEGTESGRSACASCTRGRSSFMSKKFPDLKSDEEADAWLKAADLSEYDLSGVKKVRFELARKDASISLRVPAALLATLKANAARANMPTQRLIRMMLEAQLEQPGAKPKRKPPRKTRAPVRTRHRAA